jgi:hypothetical protein
MAQRGFSPKETADMTLPQILCALQIEPQAPTPIDREESKKQRRFDIFRAICRENKITPQTLPTLGIEEVGRLIRESFPTNPVELPYVKSGLDEFLASL